MIVHTREWCHVQLKYLITEICAEENDMWAGHKELKSLPSLTTECSGLDIEHKLLLYYRGYQTRSVTWRARANLKFHTLIAENHRELREPLS